METQAPYAVPTSPAPENQYTPWVELGLDELGYYKKIYLESRAQVGSLTRKLEETRILLDEMSDLDFEVLRQNYTLMQRSNHAKVISPPRHAD
jgi:hypothetical protein